MESPHQGLEGNCTLVHCMGLQWDGVTSPSSCHHLSRESPRNPGDRAAASVSEAPVASLPHLPTPNFGQTWASGLKGTV